MSINQIVRELEAGEKKFAPGFTIAFHAFLKYFHKTKTEQDEF